MFISNDIVPTLLHKTRMNRSIRTSHTALALLSSAGIFAMQFASPAFAEEGYTAYPKLQKQQKELANPSAYVLKRGQERATDSTPSPEMIEQEKREYEKLTNSVKALSVALKRESERAGINNAETFTKAEAFSKEAARLAAAGEHSKAHEVLENGYYALTAALVKIENVKGQGEQTFRGSAKPEDAAARQRLFITHELQTNKALVEALKHQNEDKAGGKESEIEEIKATAIEATAALAAGDLASAGDLIRDANSRTKKAIVSLQGSKSIKSSSASLEASHHADEAAALEQELRNNYVKRRDSVAALLEAGRRIDHDSGTSHTELVTAESMLIQAEALAAASKYTDAKVQLDRSYVLIKDTMRTMLSLPDTKPAAKKSAPKQQKTKAGAKTQ
ncbi:MAG: hypothetical protein OEV15_02590 [Gallionella sp.]|nr:hypothetical protein [Gallionella sp.]